MSLASACAAAQAAIARAQSLFAAGAPQESGAAPTAALLQQAQQHTADTPGQMGDLSGMLPDTHRLFAGRAATQLGTAASADRALDGYLTQAARLTRAGAERLHTIAEDNRATVLAAGSARTPSAERAIVAELRSQVAQAHNVVNSTRQHGAGIGDGIRALSYGDPPLAPAPTDAPRAQAPASEEERRRNQREGFRKIFGRDPTSASDWTTASALDPHSYDPKNQGKPPNIVVGRINPVPGQGVVRTNLFIPGQKAWTPFGDNLGDNRGLDPNAGPEQSRVTIYTDYDNGIVVVRQNPSVMVGPNGAQVQAGTPDVRVSQNPNGSVLIQYHAADPFSPGGQDLAKTSPFNVNGTLVIKPTPTGPIAGGTVSDFPAIEIYDDNNGHTAELGKIMPRNTSVFGPLAGLPFSQQIGPALMGEFPDTVLPPPPLAPLLPGMPHPPPIARIPIPVVIPYPSVPLGPVSNPPQVPIGH